VKRPAIQHNPLAIDGGSPVRERLLPYGRQSVNDEDIAAVVEVLRSDWLTTGPKVSEFEDAVASYVGARYAVAFNSGTAALHGSCFAAGLGPGDEAVTTPFTFCATANCVLYMGATPVFADVCDDTLNIDPEAMAERITPRTKAVLPVDYSGHPVDLDRILAQAEEQGLVVIEDAAHALGAEYKGRRIGSLSHMTTFSFHPVKHITTGEGGMVTTDNLEFTRRLRMFRTHGVDPESRQLRGEEDGQWFYEMTELGYNYRIPDIVCALGLSQLNRLEDNLTRRREITEQYNEAFSQLPGLITPVERDEVASAWHLYPVRLELEKFTAGRKQIFHALRAENIGVNVHYIPVHMHPYYRQRFGYHGGEYPVAEAAYDGLLTLPLFPTMEQQDVEHVVEAMYKVLDHFLDDSAVAS
jgi:UDP-4-amino-4,6-dideoxy-N-acetyl-beta-L-altrosamine transaminase